MMAGCFSSAAKRSMRSISTRRLAGSRIRCDSITPSSARSYSGRCHAARILGIRVFDQLVVVGVEIDLANIGDGSHQRAGESAAASEPAAAAHARCTGRAKAPRSYRWPSRRRAGRSSDPCPAKIPRVGNAATVVKPALRTGFDAPVVGLQFIGRHDPTGGLPGDLPDRRRAASTRRGGCRRRRGLAAAAASSCAGCGGARNPDRAQRVDQARINRQPFAFHHPGVGGHRHVLSDRFNQSVAHDHRTLIDDGAADRDNFRVADRHGLTGPRRIRTRTRIPANCDEFLHKGICGIIYRLPLEFVNR